MTIKELFVDKSKTLIVNTDLALVLGDLNETIVLNQLNYWLTINEKAKKNFIDGKYWVYNSYAEWRANDFPYWSEKTIQRTFSRLESKGVVISANYNKMCIDKTKWYSIDFDVLETLKNAYEANKKAEEDKMSCREGQNDRPIPENTTENTNRYNSASEMHDRDFDLAIMQKVTEITADNTIINGIEYYLYKYTQKTKKIHPDISKSALNDIVHNIQTVLQDVWEEVENEDGLNRMIRRHFITDYGKDIDFNIVHFGQEQILYYQARNVGLICGIE